MGHIETKVPVGTNENNIKTAAEMCAEMQAEIVYDATPQKESAFNLKKIPFLSPFIKNAGEVGNELMQLITAIASIHNAAAPAIAGFQFGAIALAALDFLLIPVIYLGAFILNQKVPFTLNNNMRWFYAAALLALTLTAVLLPVTAPFIAVASAALTLVLTTVLLGRSMLDRYRLGQERKAIAYEIADVEEDIKAINAIARTMEKKFFNQPDDQLKNDIALYYARYEEKRAKLIELKEKQFEVNEKIKKVDFKHVLDKGLGVFFATVAFIGLVLSFFFPPIGLGLLMGASALALTYIVGRILSPGIKALANWISNKLSPDSRNEDSKSADNSLEHGFDRTPGKEFSNKLSPDSRNEDSKPADNSLEHGFDRTSGKEYRGTYRNVMDVLCTYKDVKLDTRADPTLKPPEPSRRVVLGNTNVSEDTDDSKDSQSAKI